MRLFTVDSGIISAVIKGVKKPNAKLKFAAQQFSFGEYTLIDSGGSFTVTGYCQLQDLSALAFDADSFIAASTMLESSDYAVSNEPSPTTFTFLLRCFKAMLYQNADSFCVCAYYIYKLLENAGYIKQQQRVEGIVSSDAFIAALGNADIDSLPSAEQNIVITSLKRLVKEFEKRMQCRLNSAKLI